MSKCENDIETAVTLAGDFKIRMEEEEKIRAGAIQEFLEERQEKDQSIWNKEEKVKEKKKERENLIKCKKIFKFPSFFVFRFWHWKRPSPVCLGNFLKRGLRTPR